MSENYIVCPYCGNEDMDSWEHALGDGDTTIVKCECGKKFIAMCSIMVKYWCPKNCKLNNEEHSFEEPLFEDDTIRCEKCNEIKNE